MPLRFGGPPEAPSRTRLGGGREGREFLARAWWVAFFPGLAIMAAVFAVNLLGDGLRDVLDPRFRG